MRIIAKCSFSLFITIQCAASETHQLTIKSWSPCPFQGGFQFILNWISIENQNQNKINSFEVNQIIISCQSTLISIADEQLMTKTIEVINAIPLIKKKSSHRGHKLFNNDL